MPGRRGVHDAAIRLPAGRDQLLCVLHGPLLIGA
jgi:hypothetical protein